MISLDDLRNMYDILNIVPGLRGRYAKWGICPLPMHRHSSTPTPSFSVQYWNGRQRWKCFGACGKNGDVIDLIGYMYMPNYDREDVKQYLKAAEILSGGDFKVSTPELPPKIPTLPQWIWKDMIPPSEETVNYAKSRGLLQEQIDKFRIGTPTPDMKDRYGIWYPQKWMSIPTFHGDELMGVKLRNMRGEDFRYMSIVGSRRGLFNYNNVYMTTDPVLILNGEMAVMVADRFGLLACAMTSGEMGSFKEFRNALALSKNIVVGDNDEHLSSADRERIMLSTQKKATLLAADLVYPPKQYKGWDDWVLDDDNAMEEVKKWISR